MGNSCNFFCLTIRIISLYSLILAVCENDKFPLVQLLDHNFFTTKGNFDECNAERLLFTSQRNCNENGRSETILSAVISSRLSLYIIRIHRTKILFDGFEWISTMCSMESQRMMFRAIVQFSSKIVIKVETGDVHTNGKTTDSIV